MKIITYRLTLEEPVLATALDGDPNSAVSYDYIPGSVLRGVLINLTMRAEGLTELDAAAEASRRCFFSHQTRFLNAYPVLKGKRSLPSPHTWEQDKYAQGDKKGEIIDKAFRKPDQHEQLEGKWKAMRDDFIAFDAQGNVAIADLQRTISVHVQRDRRYGRSLGEGQGAVYRYDALAAGQVFEAAILCEHDADAEYFKRLLLESKTVFVGGARSAGYGRVTIDQVATHDTWHETGEPASAVGKPVVITLLSDAIVRNQHGQHAADLESLRSALGISPDKVDKAYLAQSAVGGFNRKWGLPLTQMPALSMGSVLVLKESVIVDSSLVERGIGERRNEGFGRIAIGWQRPDRDTLRSYKYAPLAEPSESALVASKALWESMEKRIQHQQSEREALEDAKKLQLSVAALPKSQINRLRQIVLAQRLKPDGKLKTQIEDFFEDIKGKRADKHFEKARVNGELMKQWLIRTAAANDLKTTILIDAVLERAAKER